ncbi:MAG: class I SAM-dependent methyltransferase [Cyclobacteriaceae bacterium]
MMRCLILFSVFFLFIASINGTLAQNSPSGNAGHTDYFFKTPTRDGTGKVYMGREISQIMGFHGMGWLERDSRPEEENTALAIENLPVTRESVVADIGAGSGYYTFRIAPKVPNGKVYAVEIQDEAIQYIRNKSKEIGQKNVEAIKGNEKSPNLPQNSIDLVIMVDVYHEISYPKEMLTEIKKSLKQNGKLLLIEYRGEDPEVAIKPLHKMTVKQVEKELSANGFTLVKNGQFMNIQHFLVFEKD